ncbi:MAG: hypothetical protein ABWY78_01445 [Microvirga sp.]
MKKQTRSFVVDVKRPRLATASSSTPPASWFTKLAEALPEPSVPVKAVAPEAEPITTREERRILPDLSPVKTWNEPKTATRKARTPTSVDQITVPRERGSRRRKEAVLPVPQRETRIEAPAPVAQVGSKPKPWIRSRAEDLPRGQRWKLRIPRSAW